MIEGKVGERQPKPKGVQDCQQPPEAEKETWKGVSISATLLTPPLQTTKLHDFVEYFVGQP